MRKGAGLQEGPVHLNVVGHTLDDFIASWSESRERELLEAIKPFDEVDETFWQ